MQNFLLMVQHARENSSVWRSFLEELGIEPDSQGADAIAAAGKAAGPILKRGLPSEVGSQDLPAAMRALQARKSRDIGLVWRQLEKELREGELRLVDDYLDSKIRQGTQLVVENGNEWGSELEMSQVRVLADTFDQAVKGENR